MNLKKEDFANFFEQIQQFSEKVSFLEKYAVEEVCPKKKLLHPKLYDRYINELVWSRTRLRESQELYDKSLTAKQEELENIYKEMRELLSYLEINIKLNEGIQSELSEIISKIKK